VKFNDLIASPAIIAMHEFSMTRAEHTDRIF